MNDRSRWFQSMVGGCGEASIAARTRHHLEPSSRLRSPEVRLRNEEGSHRASLDRRRRPARRSRSIRVAGKGRIPASRRNPYRRVRGPGRRLLILRVALTKSTSRWKGAFGVPGGRSGPGVRSVGPGWRRRFFLDRRNRHRATRAWQGEDPRATQRAERQVRRSGRGVGKRQGEAAF